MGVLVGGGTTGGFFGRFTGLSAGLSPFPSRAHVT